MNTEVQSNTKYSGGNLTVQSLRVYAAENPAFNAMCHIFAIRKRARQQVTVESLSQKMAKEGFHFTKEEYQKHLSFMAELGLGTLTQNSKGRVVALKNIRVSLQSIGLAAISRADVLMKLRVATKYKRLPVEKVLASSPTKLDFTEPLKTQLKFPKPITMPKIELKSPPVAKPDDFQAFLTLVIDGKTVQYDLIPGMSTKELVSLLTKANQK